MLNFAHPETAERNIVLNRWTCQSDYNPSIQEIRGRRGAPNHEDPAVVAADQKVVGSNPAECTM